MTAPRPRRPAEIVNVRPAGPEHQVLTVVGRAGYRRRPCGTCPWRLDQVGVFPAEAFRHSARTAYDGAEEAFGCHESGADAPQDCAGYLLVGAAHNLTVRIKIREGEIDPEQITDGGHPLHESYRAMAVANGVPPDDPALRACRSAGYTDDPDHGDPGAYLARLVGAERAAEIVAQLGHDQPIGGPTPPRPVDTVRP